MKKSYPRVLCREVRTGTRTINGTDWPVVCQVHRTGERTFTLTRNLCNGVAESVEKFRTIRAARAVFDMIECEKDRLEREAMEAWDASQKRLGCPGCFYVDDAALGYGPCCTYSLALRADEDGKCLIRKERTACEAVAKQLQEVLSKEEFFELQTLLSSIRGGDRVGFFRIKKEPEP